MKVLPINTLGTGKQLQLVVSMQHGEGTVKRNEATTQLSDEIFNKE